MKKHKKPFRIRINILTKILIPTLITVTILATILCYVSYNTQKENLLNDCANTCKLVATVTSKMVNPHEFINIRTKDDITNTSYSNIFNTLTYVNSDNAVKYIYTLYLKNNNLYYGVDADIEYTTKRMPGEEFDSTEEELNAIINGEVFVSDFILYEYNEPVIYAVAPVFNASGKVIGAVGCDYNVIPIFDELNSTLRKFIIITLIAIILTTSIITYVIYTVLKQIKLVNNKMITIVNNEGDLTQQLNVASKDIIGFIAQNTNKFLTYMREMMLKIQQGSDKIDESVRRSYENMQISSENINNTEQALIEVNSSMNNVVESCNNISATSNVIVSTVNNINMLITKGVTNAINIRDLAIESNKENTSKYDIAKEKAEILTANLNKQLEKAKEIKKIANLANNILEITDQTNILALNASIEAARSGDAEKGFTIVAEEIAKLASTTGDSAAQIQKVTNTVINSVDDLTTYAQKMLTFLNDIVFNGFEELVNNSTMYSSDSKQLSTILQNFSESTTSLSANIEEVQASIKLVIENINTNAVNIDDITYISKELNERIIQLYDEINEIKNAGEELNLEVNKFTV